MSTTEDILRSKVPPGSTIPHPDEWKGNTANAPKTSELRRMKFLDEVGRKRRLTPKQIKYVQFLLQGYSKRQALLRAGYSPASVDKNISKLTNHSPVIQETLLSMKDRLDKLGINDAFIAEKFKEWLDARKPTSGVKITIGKDAPPDLKLEPLTEPDYDTQLKAYDRYEKIANPQVGKPKEGTVSRRITLEEFIQNDDPAAVEEG